MLQGIRPHGPVPQHATRASMLLLVLLLLGSLCSSLALSTLVHLTVLLHLGVVDACPKCGAIHLECILERLCGGRLCVGGVCVVSGWFA